MYTITEFSTVYDIVEENSKNMITHVPITHKKRKPNVSPLNGVLTRYMYTKMVVNNSQYDDMSRQHSATTASVFQLLRLNTR